MSRVAREVVSVLPDPVAGEVNVVVSGYRISLTADEAALLARGLLNSLGQLRWGEKRAGGQAIAGPPLSRSDEASPRAAYEGAKPGVPPAPPEADAAQQRHRTLIQASIKDKGLSLREERRS
jgi:hypothetical protein